VAATEACLDAIADRDHEIGAFVTVTADAAIDAARASEDRWQRGTPLSPLDGVPIAIKDLSLTSGVQTTFGSKLFADFVPARDVHYWARLKAAGVIMVGKTNTPEFGSMPDTVNGIGPPTRNPWDHSRSAGGSSGGAGAALAAGMVPLAEGSDAAGSIRIPTSRCGVVGIKPSRGRVSEGPDFGEQLGGLATSGPMGLTVDDCLLMLHVMEGNHAADPWPHASRAIVHPPGRVGMYSDVDHPAVRDAVEGVAREVEGLGIAVEPVTLPMDGMLGGVRDLFATGTAATPIRDVDELTPMVRMMVDHAASLSAVAYERSRVRLHRASRRLREAMAPFDAVIMPVLPEPSMPLGYVLDLSSIEEMLTGLPYTYPFNVSGQPCVSVPAATSPEGWPIGVQFVGRFGEDEVVAALAARWEAARGLPHPLPS
jgi:amidase